VNLSAVTAVELPPGPVTLMSTAAVGVPGGAVATMDVLEPTEKEAAADPKRTAVAPLKPLPMIVTDVPATPTDGATEDTVGLAATYVNWSSAETGLRPNGETTVTLTVPAADGGAVAVMEVAVTAPMVAGAEPKSTTVAPEKPVPPMVTLVPPSVGPLLGPTCVTLMPLGGVVVVVVAGCIVVVVAGCVVVVVGERWVVVVVDDPDPVPKSATRALNELTLPAAMGLTSSWFRPMGVHAFGHPAMEDDP
jgi:hypothetical protein